MFETIVIGVDGREGGEDAVRLARRLAGPASRLFAVRVATDASRLATVAHAMEDFADRHPGITGEAVVAPSPAEGLETIARDRQADLLVIGSCHRGLAGRVLAGDDAREAIRRAPCAIAVAPRDYRHHDAPLDRIGLGYDGGAAARAALQTARTIAAEDHASIQALEVVEVAPYISAPGTGVRAFDSAVEAAHERLAHLGDIAGDVQIGAPADALLHLAKEVDLLVLGREDHGRVARLLLGSAADALAARTPRPLLLVPAVEAVAA